MLALPFSDDDDDVEDDDDSDSDSHASKVSEAANPPPHAATRLREEELSQR